MNIQTIDYKSNNAGQQFVRSLHESGFAVLANHPIPATLLDIVYAGWYQFFNSEDKHQYLYKPRDEDTNQPGFHPQHLSETAIGHSTKDIKDFFTRFPMAEYQPLCATKFSPTVNG